MNETDLERCEVERLGGSFMTLGPRQMERCKNRPTKVVRSRPVMFGEAKSAEPEGRMSMCDACFDVFVKVAPQDSYVVEKELA